MSKRWWLVLVLVLVAGSFLAPAGFAQAPIKIGVIQPLSGSVAASGNYVRMGAEIARDWINAKGGVSGRKVELVIEDNKSDPKEAASAAEKLIVRDKVPVLMGASASTATLAVMPKLTDPEGRIWLWPKNANVKTMKPGERAEDDKKCLVGIIGHSPDEADAFVLMVHALLHKKFVARAGAA